MAVRADLALWLDTGHRPSLDIDSSGNANNWTGRANGIVATQGTAGDRPPYSATGWYGGPMLSPNVDELTCTVSITSTTLTFYVVASMAAGVTAGGRLISCADASGSADWDTVGEFAIARNTDTILGCHRNVGDLFVTIGPVGTRWLYVAENDGVDTRPFINGNASLSSMARSGAFNIQHIRIGSYTVDGSTRWIGEIAEIILDKGVPSTRRRHRMEGYLAHKNWNRWGRENTLPGFHPYKNRPPLIGA